MKVNISDYSGDVVAGDWSPAMRAAWLDVQPTGGTIYLDEQTITMKTRCALDPPSFHMVPLVIEGDGSSTIEIDATNTVDVFDITNKMSMTFRGLIIRSAGDMTANSVDCRNLIIAGSCRSVVFDHCEIIAVMATDSIIKVRDAVLRLVIRDSHIDGCSALYGIRSTHGASIKMENFTMWDNGNLGSTYFCKTQHAMGPWVDLRGAPAPLGAGLSTVCIHDGKFDEGASPHLYAEDYHRVECARNGHNLRGTEGSSGIYCKDVAHVIIKHENSGWSALDVPLAKFENVTNAIIGGQSFDTEVFRVEKDGSTNLRVINSPGVTTETV
jgi:hypothetical protein